MSNEANAHAIRIWQLPREQWRQELEQVPPRAALNGVWWPLRQAVVQRLLLAERTEASGCMPAGWPSRNPQQKE